MEYRRAFVGDKAEILAFVKKNFQRTWLPEVEKALLVDVLKCFIATENGKILGFATPTDPHAFFITIDVDHKHKQHRLYYAHITYLQYNTVYLLVIDLHH